MSVTWVKIKSNFMANFTSSPAHTVLMVNGKLTWLAVLNGGSNPRLDLSAEFKFFVFFRTSLWS